MRDPKTLTTGGFGLVHGDIGLMQKLRGILPKINVIGDADTGTERDAGGL